MSNEGRRCTGKYLHDGDCGWFHGEWEKWLRLETDRLKAELTGPVGDDWWPRRCTLIVGRHPSDHRPAEGKEGT